MILQSRFIPIFVAMDPLGNNAAYLSKKFGRGGTKAVSRISAVFLAAIAVMMIRMGMTEIIKSLL